MSTANRARRLIARQGLTITVVLAVLGIACMAGAIWVYTTPPTETVTEQTAVQTVSTDSVTSAVVTGNSSLYEQGERLEDMPVYFIVASPDLTIDVVTSTPEGVETAVSQRLTLEQEARRNGQVFFATNRTFFDQRDRISTGQVTASTELNVSEIRAEIARNRAQIGAVGSYQALLRLTVRYQTDRYEGTLEASTPIVFTSGAYWLDEGLTERRQHSTPVSREEVQPADESVYGGLALLSLLSLGGAGAVHYVRRDLDVDALSVAYYHEEYDEWISEGEFPTGTDKRYISIISLEDLVDIAIDSNKRVIFDPSLEVYSVVDGDLVYYFSRDPFNVDIWLDA